MGHEKQVHHSSKEIPTGDTGASSPEVCKPGSKGENPASVSTVPTSAQSPPICSSKDVSKTKKRLPQLKILLRQSGFQKLFVSSIKIDFWEMSNAVSELKRLRDATCLICIYSLNTWKPGPRIDFSWHPRHFRQIKTSLDNNQNLLTSKVGWEFKKISEVPCK